MADTADPSADLPARSPGPVPVLDGRLHAPGLLLVGSAQRKVGKTELACQLVERTAARRQVVGLKVTTVERTDGHCPRGGEGCGVCTSLDTPWCLTEETDPATGKDTSRLLAHGAERVFWLRVVESALRPGTEALLHTLGPDAVSVCESNRVRHVVEPGLFLLVRGPEDRGLKDSARSVAHWVDRVVTSSGRDFDLPLDAVTLVGGQWALRRKATAVVLAGGASRRMGEDKSLLRVDGRPLIQRVVDQLRPQFERIVISTNTPEAHAFLGLEMIPDRVPGQGPLMALASCLPHVAHAWTFVVSCDVPDVPAGLVSALLRRTGEGDGVMPLHVDGTRQTLFAWYHRRVLGAAERALQQGRRALLSLVDDCRIATLPLPDALSLRSLNTREELDAWLGARTR